MVASAPLADLWSLAKPRIVALLCLTGLTALFAAGGVVDAGAASALGTGVALPALFVSLWRRRPGLRGVPAAPSGWPRLFVPPSPSGEDVRGNVHADSRGRFD